MLIVPVYRINSSGEGAIPWVLYYLFVPLYQVQDKIKMCCFINYKLKL